MSKITAICNQKGGVGKTVTAVNLGIGLAREGKKVLLVDVDAQGSLTASLGYQRPDQMEDTLAATAIISKELFAQVQAQRPRIKSAKKNTRTYPLRGKVFCGCCRHAMPRTARKRATFYCRYTGVDEAATCHGLVIAEAELEGLLYEILSKKAQIVLNLDDLSNAGQLDIQLAEQAEYDKRIADYMDKKRVLYERLVLKQISMKEYQTQKSTVDSELDRLREIHSNLKIQTSRMQMDEKEKNARAELAREVSEAGGLTAGLADTLIDRVYVYRKRSIITRIEKEGEN